MTTYAPVRSATRTRDTFDTARELPPGALSLRYSPGHDTTERGSDWDSEWYKRDTELVTLEWRALTQAISFTPPQRVADFYAHVSKAATFNVDLLLTHWLSSEQPPGSTLPANIAVSAKGDWRRWHELRNRSQHAQLSFADAAELLRLTALARVADENSRLLQAGAIERAQTMHSEANTYLKHIATLVERIIEKRTGGQPESPPDEVH